MAKSGLSHRGDSGVGPCLAMAAPSCGGVGEGLSVLRFAFGGGQRAVWSGGYSTPLSLCREGP